MHPHTCTNSQVKQGGGRAFTSFFFFFTPSSLVHQIPPSPPPLWHHCRPLIMTPHPPHWKKPPAALIFNAFIQTEALQGPKRQGRFREWPMGGPAPLEPLLSFLRCIMVVRVKRFCWGFCAAMCRLQSRCIMRFSKSWTDAHGWF